MDGLVTIVIIQGMYFIDFNSEVPHIISGFTEAGARNDANLVYSYLSYDATAVQELTYFIKNQHELFECCEVW